MASASLADSVSQAKGITFYGSVVCVGQHLHALWRAQKISFKQCSIDVAVWASEAWTLLEPNDC